MAPQSQSGIRATTRREKAGERATMSGGGSAAVAADSPPAVTGSEVAATLADR